jgi:hypothetical protein
VKQEKTSKTWQKTPVQFLVRHKSGGYYARVFAGGKEVWRSLGASHFSVGELATLLTCDDSRGEMLLQCWHAGYHATKELMPWRDFLVLVRRGEFDYLPWLLL